MPNRPLKVGRHALGGKPLLLFLGTCVIKSPAFTRLARKIESTHAARPGAAKGNLFISLEDETGVSNAIVFPALFERRRLVFTQEAFLVITGILQNTRAAQNTRAEKIDALRHAPQIAPAKHDFRLKQVRWQ